MTKNTKMQKKMQMSQMSVFVQNCKKEKEMEIFVFCVITFEHMYIWQKNGQN